MLPLLSKKLSLEGISERFLLHLILHRIEKWLLTTIRAALHMDGMTRERCSDNGEPAHEPFHIERNT
jgi:hypothetical protein